MKKRFQGKIGEDYDLFSLSCPHHDELQGTIGKIIKQYLQNSDQETISVLEIGHGTGITSNIILSSDKRITLDAVDNESNMIVPASENLKEYEGRFSLITQDGLEYIKKKSKSYDIFVSAFTIHNFEQDYRKQFLTEIYRVLKPDGIFINADKYVHNDNELQQKDLEWQIAKFKEVYDAINRPDLRDEWIKHYLEDLKEDVIMREQEAIQIIQKLGFKNIQKRFRKHMEAVIYAQK